MRQQQVRRRAARAAEPETEATPPSRRPATPGTDRVAELLVRIDAALPA